MKKWERVRIYGKIVAERGETFEVTYCDYDFCGHITCKGTEEFSASRYERSTTGCNVWGWDGITRRNDDARVFNRLCGMRVRKSDKQNFRELMAQKYHNYAVVQCRFR